MEELSYGTKVLIKPINKTGTIQDGLTSMNNYWVDYDNEYGGKYWFHSDLEVIENDEL